MQLYPTRNATHVAAAAVAVMGAGLLTVSPAVLAWGGAIVVGLAVARSVTLLSVARVRAAGFEMVWREKGQSRRVARGEVVELAAEVRNRDTRAARYVALRAVAAPDLDIEISPSSGEVPAGGRLSVTVRVVAPRVGRHGIFGLSLEVRGSPGLFEIPLTFANPFGLEVMPAPYRVIARGARGGRSRTITDAGRPGALSGDGYELREIREHRAGDPLKRVAWKASARRGKLMVRDHEQEERDVIWVVVDASVELWAGVPGRAPLDHSIDEAAAVIEAHLSRGDMVGLVVCGARQLVKLLPGRGPTHTTDLLAALAHGTGTLDSDRSGLDPGDVAARVAEHLRPLEGNGGSTRDRTDLARRALALSDRAPFSPLPVHAPDPVDRVLRGYLSAFGIPSPPRLEPERSKTDHAIAEALGEILTSKPRASIVYVWSPAPDPGKRPEIVEALSHASRRRTEVRWVRLTLDDGFETERNIVSRAVNAAVSVRARTAETVGERALRHLGVTSLRVRPRTLSKSVAAPSHPPPRDPERR
ncbi:MAG TPA: DUF58 domain-containing protein [Polyangiaceae bacterium]|nr:DUF58 domain-containing protein [Polyangiaceae bacterium]